MLLTDNNAPRTEERHVPTPTVPPEPEPDLDIHIGADYQADATAATEDDPEEEGRPAYETTLPCDENGPKIRQVGFFAYGTRSPVDFLQKTTHANELKAEQSVFLNVLLGLHHHALLGAVCSCGGALCVRTVACGDCLQAELLCRQCWLDKHRTMPTHWALVWNPKDRFFEKTDLCRVMKNAGIRLGHYGERCPMADAARSFTLVDSNGIHATAVSFCRCNKADGSRIPDYEQLLRAGIFPGSVKEPKTGYTLSLLEYYRQERSQGKGSAYNFVHVLQRMADPFFEDAVPVGFYVS